MRTQSRYVSFQKRSPSSRNRAARPRPLCRRLAIEPVEGRWLLNAAPVAGDDLYETLVGQTLVVGQAIPDAPLGVLANDTDADGDELVAMLDSPPDIGAVQLSSNGSFTFIPAPGFTGTDTFTYRASDGTDVSNVATVRVRVTAPATIRPMARNDAYQVQRTPGFTVLSVPAETGLLANDFDQQGDALRVVPESSPRSGIITVNADGSFRYEANAHFVGVDSFTYSVMDPARNRSDHTTVTITVSLPPDNQAPVVRDDSYAVALGQVLEVNDVAPGVPMPAPFYSRDYDRGTATPNGRRRFLGEFGPQRIGLTVPELPEHQSVTVVFDLLILKTWDGRYGDLWRLTTGNDEVLLDTSFGISGFPGYDQPRQAYPDNNPADHRPGTGASAINTLGYSFGGDAVYHIRRTFAHTDAEVEMWFEAYGPFQEGIDNESWGLDNVRIYLDAGTPLGVLANDSDANEHPLTVQVVSGPARGALEFNPDGTFRYIPNAGFVGTDQFTYRASDGISQSNIATVTIDVSGVPGNHPPVANPDAYSTPRGQVLRIGGPSDPATAGVLANDTDADGDPLTALLASYPINGSVQLAPDGSLVYIPAEFFEGDDSFTYRASDGIALSNAATVMIHVEPPNRPPVARDDSYAVDPAQVLIVDEPDAGLPGVLANDSDSDEDALTAELVTSPQHGTLEMGSNGSFTYDSNDDFAGVDGFTYRAFDGQEYSTPAIVSIRVRSTPNTPPVAVDDECQTMEGTPLIVEGDGCNRYPQAVFFDNFEAGAASAWSNRTTSTTPVGNRKFLGEFAAQEVALFLGDLPAHSAVTVEFDLFIMKSWDGNGADFWKLAVDGGPILLDTTFGMSPWLDSQHPRQSYPDPYPANHPWGTGAVEVKTLGYTFIGDTVYHLKYTFEHDDESVRLLFAAHGHNQEGVDNESWGLDNVRVYVSGPAPIQAGVLANDSDADGDPLTAILETGAEHGEITLNADGTFTYTPQPYFFGTDRFVYRALDGSESTPATVTINVVNINQPPTAVNDSYVAVQGEILHVGGENSELPGLLANDTDLDGDALAAVLVSPPEHGTLTLNPDGTFTYVGNATFTGADRFMYRASDGQAQSNMASVVIDVQPANRAPVAIDDSYTTQSGVPLAVPSSCCPGGDMPVLFDTFENGASAGWSDWMISATPINNRRFLGEFGAKEIALSLRELPEHTAISLDFHLFILKSYDGNGGDFWKVGVDGGPVLLDTSFGVAGSRDSQYPRQSYPDPYPADHPWGTGAEEIDTLGYNFVGDTVYHLSFTFEHAVPDLRLLFTGYGFGQEGIENESWGLDNVRVVLRGVPSFIGVLANDADPDGDLLAASMTRPPEHGQLELSTDGSFVYRPAEGFVGEDRFVYVARDPSGAASNETAVTITVLPAPPGDFNGDRLINAIDIDMLMAILRDEAAPAAAAGPLPPAMSMYDLTGDFVVDRADADYLIGTVLETAYGDVDLDGRVGLRDFALVQSGLARTPAGWADGDLNGDQNVDRGDLALLSANIGFRRDALSLTAAPQAVVAHVGRPARSAHDAVFAHVSPETAPRLTGLRRTIPAHAVDAALTQPQSQPTRLTALSAARRRGAPVLD